MDGGNEGRILVVGDAGQRVYPGAWRLSDLGLEVRGRAFTLSVSYRSADEIMKAVGALGTFLSPREFGDDGLRSLASSTVSRARDQLLLSHTGAPSMFLEPVIPFCAVAEGDAPAADE